MDKSMTNLHPTFIEILESLCSFDGVHEGNMMSSPAITLSGKVFAFQSKKGNMVFKFGSIENLPNRSIAVTEFNPFKNKGPLRGWYEVHEDDHQHWQAFANVAYELMKSTGR
ncbi:MAG: hypothetical protein R2813_09885 [Flavobacteriales bacterium]